MSQLTTYYECVGCKCIVPGNVCLKCAYPFCEDCSDVLFHTNPRYVKSSLYDEKWRRWIPDDEVEFLEFMANVYNDENDSRLPINKKFLGMRI